MKKKISLTLLLVFVLVFSLAGCNNSPDVGCETIREVKMVVTAQDIALLETYPHLEKADLTGSTCYAEIAAYMAKHPEVAVTYTVELGGTTVPNGETALTLTDGSYDYNTLLSNIQYLPKLISLSLPATRLATGQVDALRKAYPNLAIDCSIRLNGVELNADTTELNLSAITSEQVDAYAEKLGLLPNLEKIELMAADGTSKLSLGDVKKLQAAAPNAKLNYTFTLFGKTISVADQRMEFVDVKIGDEGEQQLRDALDILTTFTYVKLENCGLSEGVITKLRSDYPNIEFVWSEKTDDKPDSSDPDPVDPGPSTSGPSNTPKRKVTTTVTASTISKLEQYKYLEEADLTGSTCYDAILSYMRAHPTVDVYFDVPLGGTTVKNTTADLVLKSGTYDYASLLANLKYITSLKHLTLPATSLTGAQLQELKATYPKLDIGYTLALQGTELNDTVTSVDLSSLTPDQVDAAIAQLQQYPNVVYVELMNGGKSNLAIADVKKLHDAVPNVVFHYSFNLFGKTVSTTDQRIEFVKQSIGDKGESTIRAALDILDGCTYFLLDDCGVSNEILADIRSDYPNTKVVWRIHQYNKGRSWLTDTKVLRAVYGIDDSNSYVLRYLNEVKYMDLGHNTEMVDISFCAYMPDLEIAILSGAPIKDVSPLANCKKLEFLELAWCGHIKDISALAGCDGLRHLNLGQTKVKDLSPLKDLDLLMLSHVTSGKMGITADDWQVFREQHPDCWITSYHKDGYPYSTGWRYKATNGYTDIYRKVRDVFGYDAIDKVLQGNG